MAAIQAGHGCTCKYGIPSEDIPCPYIDERLVDPSLTEHGKKEASVASNEVEETATQVCTVFASPLKRTLETAQIVFPKQRIAALEGLREQLGVHHCDKRSDLSKTRCIFPSIDFTLLSSDEDVLWTTNRETKFDLATRGRDALLDIFKHCQEDSVGIVSHSSFLYALVSIVIDTCDYSASAKPFATGEVRPLSLSLLTGLEEIPPSVKDSRNNLSDYDDLTSNTCQ